MKGLRPSFSSLFLPVIGLALLSGLAPLPVRAQTSAPDTNAPAATNPAAATTPADTSTPPAPADAPMPAMAPLAPSVTPSQAQSPAQEEIKDIRPPFYFIHSLLWLWIPLAVLALVGLLFLVWHLFKPHRQLSAKTAYELTLEKLEQARALLREDNPMPYAVLVSETIRTYLGQRFRTPSTRRTTEEFLRLMETREGAPLADHRDLLRHFLQACDLVKFARYQPTLAELEEVQQRAVGFVTATKPQAGVPQGVAA